MGKVIFSPRAILIAVVVSAALIVSVSASAKAATFIVSPADSLADIQAAVDAAQKPGKGGTVFFTAGTYDFGGGTLKVRNKGDVLLTADAPADPKDPDTYKVTITGNPSTIIKAQAPTVTSRKPAVAPVLLVNSPDRKSQVSIENLSIVSEGSALAHLGDDLGIPFDTGLTVSSSDGKIVTTTDVFSAGVDTNTVIEITSRNGLRRQTRLVETRDSDTQITLQGTGFGVAFTDETADTYIPGVPQNGGNLSLKSSSLLGGTSNPDGQHNFGFVSLLVGAVSVGLEDALIESTLTGRFGALSHDACIGLEGRWTNFDVLRTTAKATGGGAIILLDYDPSVDIEMADNIAIGGETFRASIFVASGSTPKSALFSGNDADGSFRIVVPGAVIDQNFIHASEQVPGFVFLLLRSSNAVVTNNQIEDTRSSSAGLNATATLLSSDGVTFTQNQILVKTTGTGTEFGFGGALVISGTDNLAFSDNTVSSEGTVQTKPAVLLSTFGGRGVTNLQFTNNEIRGEFSEAIVAMNTQNSSLSGTDVSGLKLRGPDKAHFAFDENSPPVPPAGEDPRSNELVGTGIERVDDRTDDPHTTEYDGRNTLVNIFKLINDPSVNFPTN